MCFFYLKMEIRISKKKKINIKKKIFKESRKGWYRCKKEKRKYI